MIDSVTCHECGGGMSQRPTPDGEHVRAGLTLQDGTRVWRRLDVSGLPEWHCDHCGMTVTDESRDDGYVHRYATLFADLIPLAMHPATFSGKP